MKLQSGDLVRCSHAALQMGHPIELYSNIPSVSEPTKRIVGTLEKTGAALVIWASQDSTIVYIVGPSGTGFTFGALLTKIEKVV